MWGVQLLAAGGQHDSLPGVEGLAAHLDYARPGKSGVTANKLPALPFEALNRDTIVPVIRSFTADTFSNDSPIGCDATRPGHARYSPRLGDQVGRSGHHLRRDAAPIRTLATHEVGFDTDDIESMFCQTAGDLLAGRSHSHNGDIN